MALTRYLSVEDIASWYGVQRGTVAKWRVRHPGCPEPDATIGDTPGWLPGRRAEFDTWRATFPGQGAGGGRPRAT